VRLADVAEHAGVSTAVVSYVINDGPRPVAAGTKEKVLASIKELGYRPNRVARALASRRTGNIGLVVPDTTNAFFSDLIHAVESAAFAANLLTMIGNSNLDVEHEQAYVDALVGAKVDGLIIATTDLVAPTGLEETETSLVYLHRRPRGSSMPLVRANDRKAAMTATEYLLSLGFKTVDCLGGPERFGPIEARERGWRDALKNAGITPPEPIARSEHRRSLSAAAVQDYLRNLSAPAALFTCTDEQALGVLSAASRLGIRVPEDLAVVGCDGTSASAHSVPALTTVAFPIPEMGAAAVDIIRNGASASPYLDRNSRAEFKTSLVIRDSAPK